MQLEALPALGPPRVAPGAAFMLPHPGGSAVAGRLRRFDFCQGVRYNHSKEPL